MRNYLDSGGGDGNNGLEMDYQNFEMNAKPWLPFCTHRGLILMVHGMGEHIGRYKTDGQAMSCSGYIFAGFDQRRLGQS